MMHQPWIQEAGTSPSPKGIGLDPIVIAGGGFGGLYTALALAEQPVHPPLLLIEPNDHFLFLPLLYELLSGELRRWQIAPSYQSLLAGKGIGWLKDKVDRIDTNSRQIHTAQGHMLGYSHLVLATGASSDAFGVPGVKEHALGFRTLADVERLQALVRSLRKGPSRGQRLAIVGGGPGGVELACKLADMLGDRAGIELIEQGPSLLSESRAFNREQGQLALRRRGVRIRCGTRVQAVRGGQLELATGGAGPEVGSPETLAVAAVIWTAGLRCQPPGLLPVPACDNRGRLLCSSDLRLQNHADIYVAGDLARILDSPGADPQDAVPEAPTTAQVAFQAARVIAANIGHSLAGEALETFAWKDLGEMLSLGLGEASLTGAGFTLAGSGAYQLRRLAYLARLPGLPLQIRVAAGWLAGNGDTGTKS
jgi:NADH dehydrogenase